MEFKCRSQQDHSYPIHLEWNLLRRVPEILANFKMKGPFFVITDKNVWKKQGKQLQAALKPNELHTFAVEPGETSKSLANWGRLQEFFFKKGAHRRSVVIAFGGGVVGDLAGFSASTYMRGLDLIMVPTTVLSQSDSSIGAKVAVNHPKAKNLIGSFYQPKLVLTDPSLLSTLPPREFSAGLGEAIKYGVIADPRLFDSLYEDIESVRKFDRRSLTELITRCVRIKIQVVEEDEREFGLRKILNFGHTIGHALEQATGYKQLRHGEAVGWGMLAAGFIARGIGMWDAEDFRKLQSILFRSGCLHSMGRVSPGKIMDAVKHDKKKTGKGLAFVLPERTGKVAIVNDVDPELVQKSIRFLFDVEKDRNSWKQR